MRLPSTVLRGTGERCGVFRPEPSGIPLGLLEDSQFASGLFQLKKDDVLVLYTDGITEVENSERELWGRERLENLLRACRDYKPAQIIERILLEISSFSRNAPQRDDMTLVVIGVKDKT